MEALRHDNLVYIPLPKHASRSYIHFFETTLGWTRTESYHINWNKDTVFAHLLNPITRHVNGVVQILEQSGLEHLLDSDDFTKLLSTSIFFDRHTYPITRMFDIAQCYKIDWLLLDHHVVSGQCFTQAFLKSHGIDIEIENIPLLNESDIYKQKLRKKLLHTIEDAMNSLIYVLQEDLNLYNKVLSNTDFFEMSNKPWQQISYQKNFVEKHGFQNLLKTRFNLD